MMHISPLRLVLAKPSARRYRVRDIGYPNHCLRMVEIVRLADGARWHRPSYVPLMAWADSDQYAEFRLDRDAFRTALAARSHALPHSWDALHREALRRLYQADPEWAAHVDADPELREMVWVVSK